MYKIVFTPGNRRYLLLALVLMTIEWTIFKMIYPYPNLSLDSYHYIRAAVLNLGTNVWPIGYSKFLQVFGFFSHSAVLFVTVQFVFLQLSCLVFFFTWIRFFRPGKILQALVFALLFVNPIFLYCSNYILSDALFVGLSILWVSLLIQIICRPRPWMIPAHALVLLLAFTVRYNALYYPFIGILAFLFSRQGWRYKMAGIGLPLVFAGLFMIYTSGRIAAITGQRQFSPFGGWKLANNALYAYAHVYPAAYPAGSENIPAGLRGLDDTVRQFFQSAHASFELSDPKPEGSYFVFGQGSPLVHYMGDAEGDGISLLGTRQWLAVAPLYQDYGNYLVRKYPFAFLQYFLLPNFFRYTVPPQDMAVTLSPFHLQESFGGTYVRQLFGLETIAAPDQYIRLRKNILDLYPIVIAFSHFVFLLGAIGFLCYGGLRRIGKPNGYAILLIMTLWLCDLFFITFSAVIVMRYMIFMMIPEMAFGLYFLVFVYRYLDKGPAADATTIRSTGMEP